MNATITADGKLVVSADTSLEAYALWHWWHGFVSDSPERASVLAVEFDQWNSATTNQATMPKLDTLREPNQVAGGDQ